MEGTKTKYILVALVVIVIVTASIGFYLIKDAGVEGITAMEGKAIADEVALNWSENATLCFISAGSQTHTGKCQSFAYIYYINYSYPSTEKGLSVRVFVDGHNEHTLIEQAYGQSSLGNWIVDSDEAYTIARQNNEIKQFLSHNPLIETFSLETESEISVWSFLWAYDAGFDNPKSAQIKIDANTGEVLYVEADN